MDRLKVTAALASVLAAALIAAAPPPTEIAAGRALYDYGDGLTATIPGVVTACAACHGSDGRGRSEGGVAAPSLLALGGGDRAAAARVLLAALRDGRGADGRPLLAVMPRIAIGDGAARALAAYLRALPTPPYPGIDPRTIRVAIDLRAAPLSPLRAAIVRQAAQASAARLNAAGSIFGRVLEIAAPGEPAFLRVAWAADAAAETETVAFRAGRSGDADCPRCCASLHPPVDEQAAAVRAWLQRQARDGGRPAIVATLPADMTGPGTADDLYLIADAPGLTPPRDRAARVYLVLAGDVDRRRAAPVPDGTPPPRDPAERNLAIETDLLIAAIADALLRAGRHPSPRDVCQTLRESPPTDRRLSIVDVADGTVTLIDPDPHPQSAAYPGNVQRR